MKLLDPKTYIVLSCPECVFGPPLQVKTVEECILLVNRSQDVIELASFFTTSPDDDKPDIELAPWYGEDGDACVGIATMEDVSKHFYGSYQEQCYEE